MMTPLLADKPEVGFKSVLSQVEGEINLSALRGSSYRPWRFKLWQLPLFSFVDLGVLHG
jgi:hypothetical protein